jgi:hypothetical protein
MGVRCVQFHVTSEHAPVSGRVRACVSELDLLQARKGVILWLARRATKNGVAFPREREMHDRTRLRRGIAHRHAQRMTSGELDRPDTNSGPLLFPACQGAPALPKHFRDQKGDALRVQRTITRALALW